MLWATDNHPVFVCRLSLFRGRNKSSPYDSMVLLFSTSKKNLSGNKQSSYVGLPSGIENAALHLVNSVVMFLIINR